MLQIGARIIHSFSVTLNGKSNFSRVLMIKHHQTKMIRRRGAIKGWWKSIKERQEGDIGQ